MNIQYKFIRYEDLSARQQESYNYQMASAVLANYGFTTIRLSDDWQGADFIAQHIDGKTFLKIQLKGRASFDKKYSGRDIYICFCEKDNWYLYPHDEVLELLLKSSNIGESDFWKKKGYWNFPYLTKKLKLLLAPYKLQGTKQE